MNRREIREAVRDILGDTTQGFWTDAELDRHLQLACNRHAQEALSVPDTERTTSLPGVQEYVLPPYFGEMRRVRWHTDTGRKITLVNVPKSDVVDRSDSLVSVSGDPTDYYHDTNRIGLYPIPNKKPIFVFEPGGVCNHWQTIDTARNPDNDYPTDFYQEVLSLALEGDVCSIFCSHVSLLMRRNARPVQGAIRLKITPTEGPDYVEWYSRWINVQDLGIRPEWVHFDFTYAPFELTDTVDRYTFSFILDDDFIITPRRDAYAGSHAPVAGGRLRGYADAGPQFGVRVNDDGTKNMYFQLHEFREDIELDFYKNEVEPIESDTEDLEVPNIYHRTLIKDVAQRALRKGGRSVDLALYYESQVKEEIEKSRAQAVLRTRGRIRRTEGTSRRYSGPDASYANGVWRIRV